MTTPRPRPAAKPRIWKAWAVPSSEPDHLVHLTVESPFNASNVTIIVAFKTRADARRYFGGASGECPVEIREVPATPRKRARKSKGAKR